MLKHRLQMQSLGIVLLLSAILLWPLNSYAQNACFSDEVAGRIVVSLEQAKIAEQQLSVEAESNTELQAQVEILKGTVKLYEEQIVVYKNMAEMNQKMSDMKDKACAEQVKAATPTFWQNIGKYTTGGVIGAVVAAAAMLLL